jgi:uncharacterized glyoxalase superfamily protein PhnB
MQLTFSHVDVLVNQLEPACAYYQQILGAEISTTQVWERGGLHVRYAIARMGQERFMLVQPLAGNLKVLLDEHGEGMIYRHCYSTPDIEVAYDQLLANGVQPERKWPAAGTQRPAIAGRGANHLAAQALWAFFHRDHRGAGVGGIHRGSVCLKCSWMRFTAAPIPLTCSTPAPASREMRGSGSRAF